MLESNGKSLSSKYLEPSILQNGEPAFSATACFFAQICKKQQALGEGKKGHMKTERATERAHTLLM